MTKNTLLNIAITFCRFIKLIYILSFLVLTTFFIHFQINSDSYNFNEVKYNYEPLGSLGSLGSLGFQFSKTTKWKEASAGEYKEVFAFHKIKKTSLYFNYFKLVAVLVFMFLSVKEFQKVLQSVMSIQTFQIINVQSFRRIGIYILVIFLLTSYDYIVFQQGGFSHVHFSFTLLPLMILAFIMAEIFKEGNLLKTENELTI